MRSLAAPKAASALGSRRPWAAAPSLASRVTLICDTVLTPVGKVLFPQWQCDSRFDGIQDEGRGMSVLKTAVMEIEADECSGIGYTIEAGYFASGLYTLP